MADAPERPGFIRRHRLAIVLTGLVALAGLAWLAFGWFEVQALWIDDEVDEAAPVFESGAGTEPTATTTPPSAGEVAGDSAQEPVAPTTTVPVIRTVARGQFAGRTHPSEGTASVLTDGSPQRFLRFTEFATDNGPDVDVYLSTAAPDADEQALDDDVVSLGDLKGNIGDQNYEIPPEVDLDRYNTVVLWCVRFSVAFGTAPLDPV